jgi:hypothetical protein
VLIGLSLYIAGVLAISLLIFGYQVLVDQHSVLRGLVPTLSFIGVAAVVAPIFESYGRRSRQR